MMMKSSSLLLLGVTCLFLLLLVQEGQGLECYHKRSTDDESTEFKAVCGQGKDLLDGTCDPNRKDFKADRCGTRTYKDGKVIKNCACSGGLKDKGKDNDCQDDDRGNICVCDKDLCNVSGSTKTKPIVSAILLQAFIYWTLCYL